MALMPRMVDLLPIAYDMRATETGTSTFSLEKTTVGTSRVRAELVGYFSSSGSFLLWEENVLCFDSILGIRPKASPHLLYLRRMLKEQLPIRMLFKELLQQIILKQLIKRIRLRPPGHRLYEEIDYLGFLIHSLTHYPKAGEHYGHLLQDKNQRTRMRFEDARPTERNKSNPFSPPKDVTGKAVATTSAQNQGGHNGDGDDERKRKEADEAYRRLQIRKAEKAIAELLHNLTKDDHFPSFPSQKEWLNVTRKVCDDICSELGVKPETRRAFVNGLCVDLSTSKRNSSHFLQFIDEMLKSLSEGRRTMILSVLSSPALVSGLMVARAKNPVHSVLFSILVFRNTSGLLILLGLDFSAMIFPVVHIGAIAVSFLFVVMMFHIQIAEIHEEVLRYLPVSAIIGLIFWWEMFFILDNESIPLLPTQRKTTSLRYTVYAGKSDFISSHDWAIVLTMHRTTKEDYNEEDDRPPHDLLKGKERARSVLPIPVVVVSVKYTVPIVTVAVFPSVVRAKSLSLKQSDKIFNSNLSCQPLHPLFSLLELPSLLEKSYSFPPSMLPPMAALSPIGEMRSLNHFLFDLVVKLLQLELENLKNGPEKKETPSNGTGLDHRLAEVSHAGNFDRSSGGRVFELGTIPSDTVFEMRQEKSQFESLSLSYTLFAVEKWMGLLATVPGIHLSQTSTFRDPPSAILKEAAPTKRKDSQSLPLFFSYPSIAQLDGRRIRH
uniref:NADH-ubiquinone oxidoreductase chain 6 n=1 Tax=Salix viminalis TaxID=40686 RepID=A0A6N2MNA9_SALVM